MATHIDRNDAGRTDSDNSILSERSTTVQTTQHDFDTLAEDEQSSVPPRDVNRYEYTDHFKERLHEKHRYIQPTHINTIIRDGQFRYSTSDGWRIVHEIEGIELVLIVDCDVNAPVIITGYAQIADWDTALDSDKWNDKACNIIYLCDHLSNETDVKDHVAVNMVTLESPAHIFGHTLVTDEDSSTLTCERCGVTGTKKTTFREANCHTY